PHADPPHGRGPARAAQPPGFAPDREEQPSDAKAEHPRGMDADRYPEASRAQPGDGQQEAEPKEPGDGRHGIAREKRRQKRRAPFDPAPPGHRAAARSTD